MSNSWMMLIIAGLCEVGWAVGLKYTEGFSKTIPTILTITAMIVSMVLLGRAVQKLPIGTAYGIWVGIGALGSAVLGILLFKEPATGSRLFFLTLLMVSIVGLKMTSPH
jgi:quaternary ammonium compound-resistance protein SugE